MKRNVILSLLLTFCVGICQGQYVRDSNNSYLGKVESDGTGRLAHTTRSAEQVGMRQLSALDGILQCGGQRLLSYDGVERRRAVFSR